MWLPASYSTGFAPRDDAPLYPQLWRGCCLSLGGGLGPTGSMVRDWSATKDNGAATAVVVSSLWQVSKGRYCLNFGGGDERVLLSQFSKAISAASQYSFAIWFNADSVANSPVLVSNSVTSGFNDFFLELDSGGTKIYWGDGGFGAPFRTYTTSGYSVGVWCHLAVVRTGPGDSGKLYLNGVEQTSFTGSLVTPRTFAADIALGFYATTSLSFDGKLDDVSGYRIAIPESTIRILASRRGIAYEMQDRRWARQIPATTSGYSVFKSSIIRASA